MIITKILTKQVEVKYIDVTVPVRFEEEDIPFNAPMRDGDLWKARIDVDKGVVLDWPQGRHLSMYMKVCDEGDYVLLGPDEEEVCSKMGDYCPNNLLPGEWGDYLHLEIDANGAIINWPTEPTFEDFEEIEQ